PGRCHGGQRALIFKLKSTYNFGGGNVIYGRFLVFGHHQTATVRGKRQCLIALPLAVDRGQQLSGLHVPKLYHWAVGAMHRGQSFAIGREGKLLRTVLVFVVSLEYMNFLTRCDVPNSRRRAVVLTSA